MKIIDKLEEIKNESNIALKYVKKKIKNHKKSYSQCGEDLILAHLFYEYLKIDKPVYLDIGAHHPTYLSNTYFFYQNKSNGVCIEPDVQQIQKIKRKRPRDICLNVGVTASDENEADFYVMSSKTLSTFSKEEAQIFQSKHGKKIKKIVPVKLLNINNILEEYFTTCPDFISLDVEGLDFDILKSLDFEKFRPIAIITETLNYSINRIDQKKEFDIIEFMKTKGYFIYADTFINTIFVDEKKWNGS